MERRELRQSLPRSPDISLQDETVPAAAAQHVSIPSQGAHPDGVNRGVKFHTPWLKDIKRETMVREERC